MPDEQYDFNQLLHDCRSAELRRMPPVGDVLVSAGCAGTWYFEWIDQRVGHIKSHIGIEFYSPRPDDLPGNVTWIENTVGDMHDIADASCDTVLSGQNIEHLWPSDTTAFFRESWRVLRDGGLLVVDSPNRLVTEPLCWSHPEHTVELTPSEARRLAELSGFEVTAMRGLWLCVDPATDTVWSFDPKTPVKDWTIAERILAAADRPDQSFLWWMEARKTARAPDVPAMERFMTDLYDAAWAERKTRFITQVGTRKTDAEGTYVVAQEADIGALVYGPYMPLTAGRYRTTTRITAEGGGDAPVVRIDVCGNDDRLLVVKHLSPSEIAAAGGVIECEFELDDLLFGIQARVFSSGGAVVGVRLPVAIDTIEPVST